MAKGKTTGQIIKEWIQFNFIPSCLSVQNEEQAAFIPAKLVRQGGMRDSATKAGRSCLSHTMEYRVWKDTPENTYGIFTTR